MEGVCLPSRNQPLTRLARFQSIYHLVLVVLNIFYLNWGEGRCDALYKSLLQKKRRDRIRQYNTHIERVSSQGSQPIRFDVISKLL